MNYHAVNKLFTTNDNVDYRALPAKVSKSVQQMADSSFKSFFALNEMKKKGEYDKPVRIPGYLDTAGHFVVPYTKQALKLSKPGMVGLSKTDLWFKTKLKREQIQFARIVPKGNHIVFEIGYTEEVPEIKTNDNYAFCDIGMNNLLTITSNVASPLIISGKPIKSINQFYNKILATAKSKLPENMYTSHQIQKLIDWRSKKLLTALHQASHQVMTYLVSNDIKTFIIGRNIGMKQNINLGSKTNQNFVSIPFYKLYAMLEYKCRRNGIKYIETEENHTSKTSFLDQEPIEHHDRYVGRRIKRGLFKSALGTRINADINGSLNIGRKYLTKIGLYTESLHMMFVEHMHNPKLLKLSNL